MTNNVYKVNLIPGVKLTQDDVKTVGILVQHLDSQITEKDTEITRLAEDIAHKKEAECPICHYERDKHGDGLGLPEELINQYIGCEYCSIKAEIVALKEQVKQLGNEIDKAVSIDPTLTLIEKIREIIRSRQSLSEMWKRECATNDELIAEIMALKEK